MSWLKDVMRPRIKAIVGEARIGSEEGKTLWHKCAGCSEALYNRDLQNWGYVCPHCGHHLRIALPARMKSLFDEGQYQRLSYDSPPGDILRFKDTKRYTERLKEQRAKNGEEDAVIAAEGKICGKDIVFVGLNFSFMGGSMGIAVGSGFVAAALRAAEREVPLVCLTASGGARMQEGPFSLMQLPRTIAALQEFRRKTSQPYIVILTDPTMGGVSASFAMLGDIHIAEKGAMIGFAGPRVIEQTVREKLPEGFQRAEYLRSHGIVDIVVERRAMRATLFQLLEHLTGEKGQRQAQTQKGASPQPTAQPTLKAAAD